MNSQLTVAILIDGSFFLKRYGKVFINGSEHTPEEVARNLYTIAHRHVGEGNYLYRIYYYDCLPLTKRVHHPITGEMVYFNQTNQAQFRLELFEELKKKRKVALQMGYIKDTGNWSIKPKYTRDLVEGTKPVSDLKSEDIQYDMKQKGTDILIGLDIASMAYKKLADRIVLIAGDAEFAPAAMLARREGVDFILDPMWNPVDDLLFEHVDGLKSTCPRPGGPKDGAKPYGYAAQDSVPTEYLP